MGLLYEPDRTILTLSFDKKTSDKKQSKKLLTIWKKIGIDGID